jgi:hypothetical protein
VSWTDDRLSPTHVSARTAALARGLALLGAGCHSATAPDSIFRADGTMQVLGAGCFRILTSRRTYEPLSVPAECSVDGLAVRFEARLRPTFNTCMGGDVVEVLTITRRR